LTTKITRINIKEKRHVYVILLVRKNILYKGKPIIRG
jgi:hypothetical protein